MTPEDDIPFRLLITGHRDWANADKIREALLPIYREHGSNVVLVHGDAPGADRLAAQIGEDEFGWWTEPHPALWRKFGNGAGPIRNREMVRLGADKVIAFLMPGSVGTRDCIDVATNAGLSVRVYWDAPEDRARREAQPVAAPTAVASPIPGL